ncbi:hypothetical protein P6U16_00475 [Rhizobium sp. 32-5/1]|uniref:hypothetical protein n=1 Tax=Rhizobium sp. 32-5/1 TaxID=3019602 RepID=UPI00240E19BA|nr:hypothetical protein [Rhizobium sp. 32-5/1]WEZ83405.1 hypothetical protein P6U16_00475 [Rhizobium sp. 32-5/1]
MLITIAFLAFTLSADDMEGVRTSTAELKVMAQDAEADCRGYPSQALTLASCAARDVYQSILEYRHICNEGPFINEENWVACVKP